MRLHRFLVSQPLGEVVVINTVYLIKQWSKVFRYKKGDFIILFNGEGFDTTYCIDSISNNECKLTSTKKTPSYIPEKNATLYISIIKKDLVELIVQKATELGITTIVPILSERSEKKNLNEERLRKIAVEATEQCGRGDTPNILPVAMLEKVLEKTLAHDFICVLQMNGALLKDKTVQSKLNGAKSIGIFVGPEGGWSEGEEKLFKSKKITAISLGKTTLRAETAAMVGTALLLQ